MTGDTFARPPGRYHPKPLREQLRALFGPAAVGLACALPLAVMAQSAPAEKPEKKEDKKDATLPEVKVTGGAEEGFKKESTSTATRTETPLRDIPQFINTIPESLLRSQNATTLADALRNVPGISYAAAEGGTQANQVFYLRGFPAGGDLFIDGVRDIGEYNRDLFATESVDVLKGPSALMFGRGSTGGLVNQTSKVADLIARKEIGVTFGSFDQKRVTGDINAPLGNDNAVRLVAMGEESGSYRYPQDVSRLGFAPSARFNIGHPTEFTLSYYYLKTSDVTDYGQPSLTPAVTGTTFFAMPPVSPRNYYGFANNDFTDHETQIATFKVDHRLGKDATLRNTTRYARYERQLEATISTLRATDSNGAPITSSTPLENLMVTRNHDGGRTRDNDDRAFINQTDITWKLATGRVKHTILGGLEVAREKLNRWNYVLDADPNTAGVQVPTSATPLLNPDPYTNLVYTKTPNVRALAQGDTVATFVQDQLELNDQLKALLGVRWERYKAEAQTESFLTGVLATGPFARTDKMTSARAGLIWQPTATQSYYISAGNSYNPSGELGVYGGTGTNLSVANQDIDPEENRGYELGATWDFRDGLQLRAALFRNEKVNARMADATGTTVLEGKRRVDGIEIQLAGQITPNWEVYSGIAFMNAKIVTGPANVQGRTPLGVADVSGNIWTVYKLGGGWEVGGGARHSSGFWLNDANTGEVPKYTAYDATVAYVRPKYEIRLNLVNLTDKTYYTGGYQNSPNRVLPGSPRGVAVTLRYTFD
jgi:catecholate siderophore receptor